MKTNARIFKTIIAAIFIVIMIPERAYSQVKPTLAILSMDARGTELDNITMGNIVRLELEKTNRFEVMDYYEVSDLVKEHGIDVNSCFSKTKLIQVGKLINADKMLSGSVEVFGGKIIYILRVVNVNDGVIEKVDVMEYLNQQSEIQVMTQLSVNNLLGIPNDQHILDLLVNYDSPITSPKTTAKLNGPRMGVTYIMGEVGKRMQAPVSEGGLNMFPITSMFGYQYEVQYLTAGDFQALIEVVGAINGLESGYIVPSINLLNGFRFNKSGWEFGLGPAFRIVKTADGYYENGPEGDGKWHLKKELMAEDTYTIENNIDRRGDLGFSTSLIIAVGKTFKSGYLNVPFNMYVSPRKDGTVVGMTFGFNVAKKPGL